MSARIGFCSNRACPCWQPKPSCAEFLADDPPDRLGRCIRCGNQADEHA